jgi:hypothetical protein
MLEKPAYGRLRRRVAKDSRAEPENRRHCIFHWAEKAEGVQIHVFKRKFIVARNVL